MRQWLTWLFFLGKRQGKRPVFVLLLVALPLASGLLFTAQRSQREALPVALFCERPDSMTERALQSMCEDGGIFRFYRCESEAQVLRDVASRKAECGYVFPDDLEAKMERGKASRSVGAFSSPSSVAAYLAHEVVYSKLFAEYAEDAFVKYVSDRSLFAEINPAQLRGEAEEAYRESRESGRAFSFVFEHLDEGNQQEADEKSPVIAPVRGFLAVFVLLGGLMGAVDSRKDERRRVYLAASPSLRTWIPMLAVAVPVGLMAVSAGISLAAAGLSTGVLREIVLLLAYTGMVTAFGCLLSDILRLETLLYACIPVLVMGSFLFSPVFIRLGSFLPVFRVLEKLFLPTYYLNAAGGDGVLVLAAGAILLLIVSAGVRRWRQKNS
ncbi:hypothetical protein [Hominifimenecus sp. rT4P-3]|uniref:hypothetical protein n=1 Tax=Hominifimenecus sp. rT4P-3 TaxID=3242979 RepID=UPI003DA54D46